MNALIWNDLEYCISQNFTFLSDFLFLTSSFGYDLQVLGEGSISYGGEGQNPDVVGLIWSQTLDGDEVGTAHHLLLPLCNISTQPTSESQHTSAICTDEDKLRVRCDQINNKKNPN